MSVDRDDKGVEWTYPGPESGLVYWLAVDDVLGGGDVEGVALVYLFAFAVSVQGQLYLALFWRCEGEEGGAGERTGGQSERDGQLEARHEVLALAVDGRCSIYSWP